MAQPKKFIIHSEDNKEIGFRLVDKNWDEKEIYIDPDYISYTDKKDDTIVKYRKRTKKEQKEYDKKPPITDNDNDFILIEDMPILDLIEGMIKNIQKSNNPFKEAILRDLKEIKTKIL